MSQHRAENVLKKKKKNPVKLQHVCGLQKYKQVIWEMDLGFFFWVGGVLGLLIMKPNRKKALGKNSLRTYTYG